MRLIQLIQNVLKEQSDKFRKMAVDIKITNGNIFLRSFRIYDVDWNAGIVKGLTFQEEYVHARENRDPVFCFLKLDEIKEFSVPELGLEYFSENPLVKV